MQLARRCPSTEERSRFALAGGTGFVVYGCDLALDKGKALAAGPWQHHITRKGGCTGKHSLWCSRTHMRRSSWSYARMHSAECLAGRVTYMLKAQTGLRGS